MRNLRHYYNTRFAALLAGKRFYSNDIVVCENLYRMGRFADVAIVMHIFNGYFVMERL